MLGNDVGTGLTIVSATDPANGTVVVAGDGLSLTYQPDTDFHGTDTFDYTITDGGPTDTGTVTVDANSPPVAVDDPGTACGDTSTFGGAFPIPEDYHASNPADQNYFILFGSCGLLHNDTDPDGDPLTYQIVTPPAHGDVLKIDEDFFGVSTGSELQHEARRSARWAMDLGQLHLSRLRRGLVLGTGHDEVLGRPDQRCPDLHAGSRRRRR